MNVPVTTSASDHYGILTIDLEDYFMVSAFERLVARSSWSTYESRVEHNTYRLLDIIESVSPDRIRATFFCLGYVAERHPRLIREIHSRGHEIASHSHEHRRITSMSPQVFREDLRKSRIILEDLTGEAVVGFRAPSYSITEKTLWALEILAEEGFVYDSSIFPVHHDLYGIPHAPRSPFVVLKSGDQYLEFLPFRFNGNGFGEHQPEEAGKLPSTRSFKPVRSDWKQHGIPPILEIPPTTLKLFGQNLPVAGGGYFRLFPFELTRWALGQVCGREHLPFVFYIHPWELDPHQPRIAGAPMKSRFRHYHNLDKTEDRFRRLLQSTPFHSCRSFIAQSPDSRLLALRPGFDSAQGS